jgi:galactokinase
MIHPLFERVQTEFFQRFGQPPAAIVRAPGRVNLIGEHTDYNDGFVLPMAIDRAMWIALRPRDDNRVLVHSLEFSHPADFELGETQHGVGWPEYLHGMAWSLQQDGYPLAGFEGVMSSDIPVGAGLSSSAALEMATAKAFSLVGGWIFEPSVMAKAGQRAENQWVGANTGIMDQMISASGRAGHALLLDCRDLSTQHIPVPAGTAVVVMDTATRHSHTDSGYNERREQCEQAARFFGVSHLRDVDLQTFRARGQGLPDLPYRRARHVISENERVLEAGLAMSSGDAPRMGRLMNASHISMRDDFEITNDELNIMVRLAQAQPGCYGARMTGGGFGGCAVALVEQPAADGFATAVARAYEEETSLVPSIYICQASNGAEVVSA